MKPFAETSRANLIHSIRNAAEFLRDHLNGPSGAELFGETFVQILRDYYLYRTGQFLLGGIGEAVRELELPFSDEDIRMLVMVEKAMRMEEDYLEAVQVLKPDWMNSMAAKISGILG